MEPRGEGGVDKEEESDLKNQVWHSTRTRRVCCKDCGPRLYSFLEFRVQDSSFNCSSRLELAAGFANCRLSLQGLGGCLKEAGGLSLVSQTLRSLHASQKAWILLQSLKRVNHSFRALLQEESMYMHIIIFLHLN